MSRRRRRSKAPIARGARPDSEDRLVLFVVCDTSDDENVVEVCDTEDQARSAPYPARYPIYRLERGELGEDGLYVYDTAEQVR